ncbi:hypothetical protein C1N53_11860 [Pontibacter sp. SGAir0037]|nr:hypothetical protein C1N53_11860 [Pontibacter sp. SGAir0037]
MSGFVFLFVATHCRQAQDIKAFTEATYRLESVEDVQLNGVDMEQRLQTGQRLTATERDSLLLTLTTDRLRLSARLSLHVALQEPGEDRSLTVTSLRWLLQVDGDDALTGIVEETMVLQEGLNTIPINTPVLLTQEEGQPNYAGLNRLITLIAQQGDIRQNITFKIKPTVKTPVGNIEAPNYITVSKPAGS